MHAGGVLQSWKQIANYVGRTERTVQRWEQEFGFPIRRPSGKARSAVMALVSEIEEWTRGKPSLVEIQRTGRLPREKFQRDVTPQEVTIKPNLSPSPERRPFEENLANFPEAIGTPGEASEGSGGPGKRELEHQKEAQGNYRQNSVTLEILQKVQLNNTIISVPQVVRRMWPNATVPEYPSTATGLSDFS